MKTVLIICMTILIVVLFALFFLGKRSASGQAIGLVDGKLAMCPDTPNCVCSEYANETGHYIEPIETAEARITEMDLVQGFVKSMGGTIQSHSDNYLSATFSSSLFSFVDDVEVRIDAELKVIHFRSASRVGRGDLGVNRKRIEQLKELLNGAQ